MINHCIPLCYTLKEIHLFDNGPPFSSCGSFHQNWNHAEYSPFQGENECLALTITPSNAILPPAAEFFAKTKPKMMGLLRDPVDRLVSQLNMECCRGREKEELLDEIQIELKTLKELYASNSTPYGFGLVPEGLSFDTNGKLNWGRLTKSLFDVTLSLYPQIPKGKGRKGRGGKEENEREGEKGGWWEFDTLVHDCPSLAEELAGFVGKPEAVRCLKEQCYKGVRVRPGCGMLLEDCARREDIDKEVVKFLREHNRYWYGEEEEGEGRKRVRFWG